MGLVYTKNEPVGQPAYYSCFYPNRKYLGMIEQEVDGFYYFYPEVEAGFWPAFILKDLANKLDSLNEAWSQKIAALGVPEEPKEVL